MKITVTIQAGVPKVWEEPELSLEKEKSNSLYFTFKGLPKDDAMEIDGEEDEKPYLTEEHIQILSYYLNNSFSILPVYFFLDNLNIEIDNEGHLYQVLKQQHVLLVSIDITNCKLESEEGFSFRKPFSFHYLFELPDQKKTLKFYKVDFSNSLEFTVKGLASSIRNAQLHTLILKSKDPSAMFETKRLLETCLHLSTLKVLKLSNLLLTEGEHYVNNNEGLFAIIQLIKKSKIQILDLKNFFYTERTLSKVFIQQLAKALLMNSTLRELYLPLSEDDQPLLSNILDLCYPLKIINNNSGESISAVYPKKIINHENANLTDKPFENLCFFLENNNTVTALQLKNNSPSEPILRLLGQMLSYNSSLQLLDLSSNNLNRPNQIKDLTQGLIFNGTLKQLKLSYNQIKNESMRYLANMLILNSSLTSLDLRYNCIQPLGFQYLTKGLLQNSALLHLNLQNNHIFRARNSYVQLARLFYCNTTLRVLSLDLIKGKHLGIIVKSLGANTTLKELNLGHTKISEIGTKYIAEALKYNTVLEILKLYGARINLHIAEMLKLNSSLTMLGLRFDFKMVEIFVQALQRNSTVREIDFIPFDRENKTFMRFKQNLSNMDFKMDLKVQANMDISLRFFRSGQCSLDNNLKRPLSSNSNFFRKKKFISDPEHYSLSQPTKK